MTTQLQAVSTAALAEQLLDLRPITTQLHKRQAVTQRMLLVLTRMLESLWAR
jgi:hypothetical protein